MSCSFLGFGCLPPGEIIMRVRTRRQQRTVFLSPSVKQLARHAAGRSHSCHNNSSQLSVSIRTCSSRARCRSTAHGHPCDASAPPLKCDATLRHTLLHDASFSLPHALLHSSDLTAAPTTRDRMRRGILATTATDSSNNSRSCSSRCGRNRSKRTNKNNLSAKMIASGFGTVRR